MSLLILDSGPSSSAGVGAFTGAGNVSGVGAALVVGVGALAGSGVVVGSAAALAAGAGVLTGSSAVAGAGSNLAAGSGVFIGSGDVAGITSVTGGTQTLIPRAGRGAAGVTRGSVMKTGGVTRTGGIRVSLPSPTGEWNPQWQDSVVDFDRDAFTRFIEEKGYSITWEKAVLCPNVPGTGLSPRDHFIGCPICGGSGYVYVDAIPTRMLMQGVRLNQSFFAYGRWDAGNMLVTAEPEFTIDYYDRLTLGNGVGRFTQRLVRQPGTTDRLKYAPLCFHYVAWVDRSGALTPFVNDVHFRASADGIEWSSTQPDSGGVYTVSYDYRPRYVVLDLVHHHRDSTVEGQHYQFPVQAVAKLDFLIRNEGADARQVVDKNPFE